MHLIINTHHMTRAGDERPGREAADIIFMIDEKPHPQFKREGNDLVYTHRVPLVRVYDIF